MDQPLGPLVSGQQAEIPQSIPLIGKYVSLVPLAESHVPGLFASVGQPEHYKLWTYLFEGPDPFPKGRVDLEASVRSKIGQDEYQATFWVPVLPANISGEMVQSNAEGHVALWRMDLPNRSIEIAHVILGEKVRGKQAGTEIMYLLLKYVFESLHYRRCEWKCDNFNEPSKKAARRLGLTFEGVFRQHMIRYGRNRDTAWFSILDCEWPTAKKAFEIWLSENNFDENGKQRRKLEDIRREMQ